MRSHQPHSSFSVKLGVRQAFSAAATFSNAFKTPEVQSRDQWSLCTLLINQNGTESGSARDQVPKLIASLPRPTQELACEAMWTQQISMAQDHYRAWLPLSASGSVGEVAEASDAIVTKAHNYPCPKPHGPRYRCLGTPLGDSTATLLPRGLHEVGTRGRQRCRSGLHRTILS